MELLALPAAARLSGNEGAAIRCRRRRPDRRQESLKRLAQSHEISVQALLRESDGQVVHVLHQVTAVRQDVGWEAGGSGVVQGRPR